jgi:hypothetical protein
MSFYVHGWDIHAIKARDGQVTPVTQDYRDHSGIR